MAQSITISKSKEGVKWSRPLASVLALLRNGEYELTIKRKTEKRTLNQNALMWMWFTCISSETGQPVQDVHDTYCAQFLARKAVNARGELVSVYGQTSRLTTAEMAEFMNHVQADAAEMGIVLPLPEDEFYNDFINEYMN